MCRSAFGAAQALSDVTFKVEPGDLCVLVGPSGSGKSTLLRLVNRLVDPTAGRVLVRDTDVTTLDPAPLRRSIGYVIQSIGLFPHRTVADNVATVPRLLGWPKAQIDRAGRGDARSRPSRRRRLRQPLAGGAFGRAGAARRPCPRPCGRSRHPAHGRAFRRRRPDHAPGPEGGTRAHPCRDRQDDPSRDARSGRGARTRDPDRRPAPRARGRGRVAPRPHRAPTATPSCATFLAARSSPCAA